VCTLEDQSSSWGTPFVSSHTKQTKLNDTISTTESDFNVATIILNSSVNSNATVTMNHDVSTMPPDLLVICNPVVTKNPEVDAINTNSSVIRNFLVTKNVEVGADSDKFCSGAVSPSNVMSTKGNEAVATTKSCMTIASESVVNSNPNIVDSTQISSVLDKSSSLITTISPRHVMCSKLNKTVSISEQDSLVAQGCRELPVISNIAIEAHSDGDRSSCLGGQPSDL